MGVFDGGRNNRGWTAPAIEVEGMTSFIDTPSVILTATDEGGGLPKVLTIIYHPDPSGFLVDTKAQGIPQAVAPILGARIGPPNERVVFWNRIILRSTRMIDIDAKHAAQQIAQVLTGHPPVGV